ncbi:hypothetical protein Fmac_029695 [Flemingia macrophylla]|uniref:Uncharacterized protein n=1 Tax=Flemingia macrophylla TaxID=520843 RepID=A0ABD1LB25_9FABA
MTCLFALHRIRAIHAGTNMLLNCVGREESVSFPLRRWNFQFYPELLVDILHFHLWAEEERKLRIIAREWSCCSLLDPNIQDTCNLSAANGLSDHNRRRKSGHSSK